MTRTLLWLLVLVGCGDNFIPDPAGDLETQLGALPGVRLEKPETTAEGYTYYVLRFTQPVDHADPQGPSFEQRVSLLHRDESLPMVVVTSGYYDFYRDRTYELTDLLAANQISIEHRFFGESRPQPPDFTHLTIEQMATDQHVIISALRTIYSGAFLTTGGSKGGMTATYHRRFFPDDVEATVPYVAPISFGAPDPRYGAFIAGIGPMDCRTALRALTTEMLQNRRAAMEARAAAQSGPAYTRIPLGPAVEASIASLEWAFWQYRGVGFCSVVPAPDATDDELFAFLDQVSPVSDNSDAEIMQFEAYYYQAYAQLGFPQSSPAELDPLLLYDDADYAGALPTTAPAYDGGAAMADIDQFIRTKGSQLLFVYGEWDPWTGGQYELGEATDSVKLVQAQGTHGARIGALDPSARAVAREKLASWAGVEPVIAQARRAVVAEPRIPPAMLWRRPRAGR